MTASGSYRHLAFAGLSDIGRARRRNEDALLIAPDHAVFGVCDGLGGAEGGREASRIIVDTVAEGLARPALPTAMRSHAYRTLLVVQALGEAGRQIRLHAARHGYHGMSSTATFLLFSSLSERRATLLHAGDSLAFRLRGDRMDRLFEPHSVEAEYGDAVDTLPLHMRHLLTRVIGIREHEQLEPTPIDVAPQDTFLVASDGLTNMVEPTRIAEALSTVRDVGPDAVAHRLVDEANAAGGRDNITVIVVHCGAA